MAHGAALSAGAELGMLAQALRGAAGLRRGAPLEVSRDRLSAYVTARMPAASRARVTEFIGELVGVPFPDEESPALWTARTDPRLLREQVLRAWSDLVRATCALSPVVLVLDDLQWCDGATIRSVTMALASFKHLPFFVLTLARPEVTRTFPKLWEEQGALNALFESAKLARINFYLRRPAQMAELLAPWRMGVTQPLQRWIEEAGGPALGADDPAHRVTLFGAFAER